MKRILKTKLAIGVSLLMALATTNAITLFQDTFDGTGALGSDWNSWHDTASGANPGQSGGSYVFDRNLPTDWAQAAVQTKPVYITAYDSVDFKFHVKDFGGSSVDAGTGDGETSFIVMERDAVLAGLHGASLDGLVLKVVHRDINFGSWPDAATDPRTWVEIRKTDDTLLGKIVVQSTNDFTLVISMTTDAWAVGVENATYWLEEGVASGLHGFNIASWGTGAGLRVESWNGANAFGSASIDSVSIETIPKANVFLEDTFDGIGALGSDWETWINGSSGANPGQSAGSYIFDRTGTSWAQAAVQTTSTVDIVSSGTTDFRFHVKDFAHSEAFIGLTAGKTHFMAGEYDDTLDSLFDSSGVDGILCSVEHQAINGGSWPDPESDPRTWVQIKKTDDTLLGVVVVQSTNDFTLVITLTTNTWSFGVEGATYWVSSGSTSGFHGYDVSTWAGGASLRMESWNGEGDFGPASIDAVSIDWDSVYEKWTKDNFLSGTNALRAADVDADAMENLFEFAVGGNPRVYDASAVLPTSTIAEDMGTNWLEYVYRRRIDFAEIGMDYGIILKSDLVSGSWTNIGTSAESGSVLVNSVIETVTNRISTAENVKFVRLEVTEN